MNKMKSLAAISLITGLSCGKSDPAYKFSSYTVVNATTDVEVVRTYAAPWHITWRQLPTSDIVERYRSQHFGAWAGNNTIHAVSDQDTTVELYNSNKTEQFDQAKGNILFLYGNSTAGYGGIFINNEAPVNHKDSVIGIRFIHLSPNSSDLTITLQDQGGTVEADKLGYKQFTNYKLYPSVSSTDSIRFIIKDASSGDSLTRYVLPKIPVTPYGSAGLIHGRCKNLTLVVKGLRGTTTGASSFSVFPVPHY